jgi:hypothetical protein
MPSLHLHGDDATNCGIVKSNFLTASLPQLPSTYNEPSLGYGKNRDLKTEQHSQCNLAFAWILRLSTKNLRITGSQLGFDAGAS